MPRLVIVLRDLYPARLDQAARAALPRLPALEKWLAHGDTEAAGGDWRQWLWRESALGVGPARSLAAIAGAVLADPGTDRPLWLATPVHFVAGLDTVRLHPAGLLELNPEEQRALAVDFTRVFAGSGYTLHPGARRELLLAGGEAAAASIRSHDPAQWLGADPRAGLPAGDGAAAMRRLGAELEMWLHEHPVNAARAERGLLTVNALWLWGGGSLPQPTAATGGLPGSGGVAWADDLFVDGLMRLRGGEVAPAPSRWPVAPASGLVPPDLLVVRALGEAPDARSLLALDSEWLAPALAQWRGGAFERATLLAGHSAVTLGGTRLRRLWRRFRRTRPWWETLLQ